MGRTGRKPGQQYIAQYETPTGAIYWARLRQKFVVAPSGCWEWTADHNQYGHGRFKFEGRKEMAHNVPFIVMAGSIDRALDRDHLCRNACCINPFHLEQVTHQVNCARGNGGSWGRGKTHCPHGHLYDEENTYIDSKGCRVCRACKKARPRRVSLYKKKGRKILSFPTVFYPRSS